jgi:hypothetical protein
MTRQSDLFTGRPADLFGSGPALRDLGIDLVTENNKDWHASAIRIVMSIPVGWRGISEDIRMRVEPLIGRPRHDNAYGALIRSAKSLGLLRCTGNRYPCQRNKSHARMTDEYVR